MGKPGSNARWRRLALGIAAGMAVAGHAHAQLTVTPAGAADGLSLSTFVTNLPTDTTLDAPLADGPFGVTVNSAGQVILQSFGNTTNYVFNDVSNQTPANALSSTPFTGFTSALVTVGGVVWGGGGSYFGNSNFDSLVKFNNDGTVNTSYPVDITNGLWVDPANGHLIAAGGYTGVIDINPADPTAPPRVVTSIATDPDVPDGIAVSEDGTTAYGATTNSITAYNLTTGTPTIIANITDPDGIGVITSTNALNGDIVVNTNDGNVYLLDPTNLSAGPVLVADNGSRGDYVSQDSNDGSLFVTQSDQVLKLSCGPGCSFDGEIAPTPAPEPAPLLVIAAAMLGLAVARRRRAAGFHVAG